MEPDAAPRAEDLPAEATGADVDDAADPWAWAHRPDLPAAHDLSGHHVTAVLVAHDGAEWLPAALQGLTALEHQPDRVVLVDAGSSDDTGDLLAAAVEGRQGWSWTTSEPGHFGRAVAAALNDEPALNDEAAPSDEAAPNEDAAPNDEPGPNDEPALSDASGPDEDPIPEGRQSWLWLLHDDAVVAPSSLGTLLAAAITAGAGVATPGLAHPPTRQDPARVSELGESVARSGHREVHVDPGEVDQGQHHLVRPVLGGSTCGLLVQRELFDQLGGLSPELSGHRDGVEFGWRATLAGQTVIAVPDARVSHRQVGLGGLRSGSGAAAAVDRSYGMALATAHAAGPSRVLTPVLLVLGALARVLGFLLGKSPERAADELSGLRRYLSGRGRSSRLREAALELRPDGAARDRADELRPGPWSGLRRVRDALGASWADRADTAAGTDLDELTGDDFAGRPDRRPAWQSVYAAVWIAMVIAALVAARALFGAGPLAGPALLPATDSLAAAFGQWLAPVPGTGWWQAPPWLGFHAVLATLLLGMPTWASALVVLGAVPLTMLAVWPLVQRLVADRRVRVWVGATLALLPVLLGGSTQGRIAVTAIAVTGALFVAAVLAMRDQWVAGNGWRHAWAAGLVLTPLVAHQPVLGGFAVAGLLALLVVERRRGAIATLAARCAVVLAVPVVALAPWWPLLISRPGWWLLGPDAALDGADPAPNVGALLLGRAGGEGLPPGWVSGICIGAIWLIALVATVLRSTSPALRTAWVLALVALLVAVTQTRLVIDAGAGGLEPTRPWSGGLLLVALGALAVAGAIGIDSVPGRLAGRDFSWLQPLTALAAVVLALITLLGAGWWVVAGGSGPLERDRDQLVPGFVVDGLQRQPGSRVLVVDATTDPVGFVVVDGSGVRLGDADRSYSFGGDLTAAATADAAARRLVAAAGDESVSEDLRAIGVRYIAVRGPDDLITRINSGAGLRVVSVQQGSRVWEITGAADSPPPAASPAIETRSILVAVGQGLVLVVVAFCAAPRLRPGRSRDPAQRARLVAAQEDAR